MAEKLYQFLGRKISKNVLNFIENNTKGKGKAAHFNTKRNSTKTAEAWRERIIPKELEFIQETCAFVLEALGYVRVENKSLLLDRSQSLVTPVNINIPLLK